MRRLPVFFFFLFFAHSALAQSLDSAMRLYYPMEDNWHDASFPFDDALPQGRSMGHTFSKSNPFGRAGSFPSTISNAGHYLRIPDGKLGSTRYITIAFWFRTNTNYTVNQAMGMFGLANLYPLSAPNHYVPMVYMEGGGRVRARIWTTSGTPVGTMISPNSLRDGNWHHLALVGDSSMQYLYVDGQVVDSLAGQITGFSGGTKATLGSAFTAGSWPAATGTWSFFNGRMDEFRVYGRTLSPGEISTLFNLASPPTLPGFSPAPQDLVLCSRTESTIRVSGSGNNLKYKWKNNWGSGGNQTNNHSTTADSLYISFVNASFAGTYEVSVYDSVYGLGSRANFNVTERELRITSQPQGGFYKLGDSWNVSVSLTGGFDTARWYKDGTPLATYIGGTTFTRGNTNLSPSDTGTYYFMAKNAVCGTIYSDTVRIGLREEKAYYPFSGNFDNVLGSWGSLNYNPSNPPSFTDDVFGNAQSALEFNGSTDFLNLNEQMFNVNRDYTIAFWVKRDVNQNSTFVDCQRNSMTGLVDGGIRIWANTSGVISAELTRSNGSGIVLRNTNNDFLLTPGEWTHIALVKSGSFIRLYVDSAQAQGASNIGIPNKAFWSIGYRVIRASGRPSVDNIFDGTLDELRFYDTAASLTQIQQWAAKPCATPASIASQTTGTLRVQQGGGTTLTVSASGAASVEWFKVGQAAALSQTAQYNISNMTAADTGRYYARLIGTCLGDTLYSDTVQLSLRGVTALSHSDLTDELRLFPNPTNGKCTLAFGDQQAGRVVRLLDPVGRVLLEVWAREPQLELSLANMPQGLYMVEVQSPNKRRVYPLMKQ